MPRGIYTRTQQHLAAMSAAQAGKPKPSCSRPGDTHSQWRGEAASYSSKHKWIYRQKGKAAAQNCAHCAGMAASWANVSKMYLRNVDDYIPLCWPCHARFDGYLHGWNQPRAV